MYDNRRVNLFFVKLGSGSKWKAFITNDLEIAFNKLMETYLSDGAAKYFSRTENSTCSLANVSAITSTHRSVPPPWP